MDVISAAYVPHNWNWVNVDEWALNFAHSLQLVFKYSALASVQG